MKAVVLALVCACSSKSSEPPEVGPLPEPPHRAASPSNFLFLKQNLEYILENGRRDGAANFLLTDGEIRWACRGSLQGEQLIASRTPDGFSVIDREQHRAEFEACFTIPWAGIRGEASGGQRLDGCEVETRAFLMFAPETPKGAFYLHATITELGGRLAGLVVLPRCTPAKSP